MASDESSESDDQSMALKRFSNALASKITPMDVHGNAFECPLCGTHAHQRWGTVVWKGPPRGGGMRVPATSDLPFYGARCERCEGVTLWKEDQCVLPVTSASVAAHDAMPQDVKEIFEEARLVFAHSPRAAAALIRLSLEVLIEPFKLEGRDLFEKIGHLGRHFPDGTTKKAADVIRVLGNTGIHPGEIDLDERAESAKAMFLVVNILVQKMIVDAAEIDALYKALPEAKRRAIDERDQKLSDSTEN